MIVTMSSNFYTKLLHLNIRNKALWNGSHGGDFIKIPTNNNTYAFKRSKDEDQVIVFLNFNNENVSIQFPTIQGTYKELFSGKNKSIDSFVAICLSYGTLNLFQKNPFVFCA